MTRWREHPVTVSAVLVAAKSAGLLSRVFRRGSGDALPGRLSEFLLPQLPTILAQQFLHGVIIVTGTNGKTSTTKMLDEILTRAGERVVSNRSGSNMKQGIVSSLISIADVRGRLRGDPTVGLFEVDEATVPLVIKAIGATDLLVTNLFRDQLDRFGEVGTIAATLGKAIEGTQVHIYLNADDPLVASLGGFVKSDRVTYFGFDTEGPSTGALKTAADSVHCPRCGTRLEFDRYYYSHLGHYRCPRGDFDRPDPTVTVSEISRVDASGSTFILRTPQAQYRADMQLGGLYNVYNATAALTVAYGVGLSMTSSFQSLKKATPAFGRLEEITWDERRLLLTLVKNPAGFTQVLNSCLRSETGISVLIAINDAEADGRDVSWLWDVPLECLAGRGHRIIVTGNRADEMALRLRYAGVESTIIVGIPGALDELYRVTEPGSNGYMLATYTAMLSIRRKLAQFVTIAPIGSVLK